jgi:hypothetical protein
VAPVAETVLGSLKEDRELVAEFVFELLVVGLLTSAPPLLCSCIGGVLGRRCAVTVPPWRFRPMACLVSFGFAAVGLTIAITPRPSEGDVDVVTEYRAVDRESGRPISGALVSVTDAFARYGPQPARSLTITDSHGRVVMRLRQHSKAVEKTRAERYLRG